MQPITLGRASQNRKALASARRGATRDGPKKRYWGLSGSEVIAPACKGRRHPCCTATRSNNWSSRQRRLCHHGRHSARCRMSPVEISVSARRRAQLSDADHRSIGHTNGGMPRMSEAPCLILTAEYASARHTAAMAVRAAPAQREGGRNRRRYGDRKNDDSE